MQAFQGICIHAHFYQPPREDPWLDSVMRDASAFPFHDWNARIHDECYKPNRAARLLDASGRIVYITNNYRCINFNVGPTLHSWLAKYDPFLSQYIVDADRAAAESFGEGGAIAQAYNHIILPLAEDRDIRTQVVWGVKDFLFRYGRKPKGMWLPETAVNTATLEALAAEGIAFTILAPGQCAAVRSPHGSWRQTPGGEGLDVTRPYRMTLPSGAEITLVFYHGGIAHEIAFGGLLNNGDIFAESLLRKLPKDNEPRLLTIATDGESYGHHHRYGEMALARATQVLSNSPDAILTNVASFLERYPPTWECMVAENTAWSCAHGVERWRSDCGCHTGGEPGWHQRWRAPLRDALDSLRDRIDEIYEREMAPYCDAPWDLRNEAIALYLMNFGDRATAEDIRTRKGSFLKESCGDLKHGDLQKVLSLIESQRMRMFMYTSCGWFFNDVAGLETRQILAYALRAAEYMEDVSGVSLVDDFLDDLKYAEGNNPALPTAYDVVEKEVIPNKRTVRDIAASVSLLGKQNRYYVYRAESDEYHYPSGDLDLCVREIQIADARTLEGWRGASAVISTGGLDDVCRLSERGLPPQADIKKHFYMGDIISISKFFENSFELGSWHFNDLSQDDKELIASERTKSAEQEHLEQAQNLLDDNQRLLLQLNIMGVSSSPFLRAAGNFVYKHRIEMLYAETEDVLTLLEPGSDLEIVLEEAHSMGIYPNVSVLAPRMENAFRDNLLEAQRKNDESVYTKILSLWKRAKEMKIEIDRWRLQNRIWAILEKNDAAPSSTLLALADALGFATPDE